jgi:hypothetical protein
MTQNADSVRSPRGLLRLADELGWLVDDGPIALDGQMRDFIGQLRWLLFEAAERAQNDSSGAYPAT